MNLKLWNSFVCLLDGVSDWEHLTLYIHLWIIRLIHYCDFNVASFISTQLDMLFLINILWINIYLYIFHICNFLCSSFLLASHNSMTVYFTSMCFYIYFSEILLVENDFILKIRLFNSNFWNVFGKEIEFFTFGYFLSAN